MSNPAPGFEKHPAYEVTTQPLGQKVEVKAGELVVASSDDAVLLNETKHKPVWYLPTKDLNHGALTSSDTQTYCPFKGYASYWHIETEQGRIEDAIWAYLDPYDECLPIAKYASFYTNKVSVYIDGELADSSGPGWTDR
ncbi:MAG: DUF427 domain-containing protein [Pseudomonadales bacterium]|nr:DUF427 domain-containing protein [Pseudomonadales bacterium]